MIGSPDKVGALAPRQFSQIVYPIGHSQRWPNENKVNGIFTFQGIHISN
jgi:hypothetical protein